MVLFLLYFLFAHHLHFVCDAHINFLRFTLLMLINTAIHQFISQFFQLLFHCFDATEHF
jgi:hypothetical protein